MRDNPIMNAKLETQKSTINEDKNDGMQVVGFAASKIHHEDSMGEIYMIAVDPDYQGRGIATDLAAQSLNWMEQQGMKIAMVETGIDRGHEPARKLYESVGFNSRWDVARYFQEL